MDTFGLGLVLSFTDNGTSGLNAAANALTRLEGTAAMAGTSFNQFERQMNNLALAGMNLVRVGEEISNIGETMLGGVTSTIKNAAKVGQDFESFRITLGTLYSDEAGGFNKGLEVADKKLQELMLYSIKTPFNVSDTKDLLVTLKSQGIDAFEEITNATSGAHEKALDWIGDLMAFKPDIPMQRWKLAIQKFLGEGSQLRLMHILDVGDLKVLLGHDLGDTIKERMQSLTEIVSKVGLTGLMEKNMGSMRQVLSNLRDEFDMFFLNIADAGVFDNLLKAINTVNSVFMDNQDLISSFSISVAEGFKMITAPLIPLSKIIRDVLIEIMKFISAHPILSKIAVLFLTISGTALIAFGAIVKFSGSIFMLTAGLRNLAMLLPSLSTGFRLFGSLVTGALVSGLQFALLSAVIFTAWNKNMFGVQTAVTEATSVLSLCFRALVMSWDGVLTLEEFDWVKKAGLLKFITAVQLLKAYIGEFFSGVEEGFLAFVNFWTESVFHIGNVGKSLKELIDNISEWLMSLDLYTTLDFMKNLGRDVGYVATVVLAAVGVFKLLRGAILLAFFPFGTAPALITKVVSLFAIGITSIIFGLKDANGNLTATGQLLKDIGSALSNISLESIGKSLSNIGTALSESMQNMDFEKVLGALTIGLTAALSPKSLITAVKVLGATFMNFILITFDVLGGTIAAILSSSFASTVKLAVSNLILDIGRLLMSSGTFIAVTFTKVIEFVSASILAPLLSKAKLVGGVLLTALKPVGAIIVSVLSTVLKPLATIFTPIISVLSKLGSTLIAILSTAFKPLLTMLKPFFSVILTSLSTFGGRMISLLLSIFGPAGSAIMSIITAIGGWKIALIAAVIGAIVAVIGLVTSLLGDTSGEAKLNIQNFFKNAFNSLPDFIQEPLKKVMDKIGNFFKDVGTALGFDEDSLSSIISWANTVFDLLFDIGTQVQAIFKNIIDWVKQAWDSWLKDLVGEILEFAGKLAVVIGAIAAFLVPIFLTIVDVILGVVNSLLPVISPVINWLGKAFTFLMQILNGLLDFVIGVFTGDWDKAWGGITSIFKGAWEYFKGTIEEIGNLLSAVGEFLMGTVVVPIMTVISSLVSGVAEFIGHMISNIVGAGLDIVNHFLEFLGSVKNLFTNIVDIVTFFIAGIIAFLVSMCTGVETGWEDFFKLAVDACKTFGDKLKGVFKAIVNAVISIFNFLIRVVVNGLGKFVSGIINGLADGIESILNYLGLDIHIKDLNLVVPEIPYLNTGGYVKQEGMAYLHPSEVVLNDPTTKSLQAFLNDYNNEPVIIKNDNAELKDLLSNTFNNKNSVQQIDVESVPNTINNTSIYDENTTNNYTKSEDLVPNVFVPDSYGSVQNKKDNSYTQDNRVIFNQGSIVIQVSDKKVAQNDLENMATQLMKIIERKQALRAMAIRG